jgi:uncharacterized protein YbjT (DUF2867 family)
MILVTGATGNVGGALARQLLAAGQPVRALTRGRDGVELPDGVDAVGGDLHRPNSLGAAFDGVSRMFLLGGFHDMPGLLSAAGHGGVRHVVLLTSRSIANGDLTNAIVKMWTDSEDAVHGSGMAWTVLRPGSFMSNTLRWLPQLRTGDVVRAPFADQQAAVIDPADIAAVARVALMSDGHFSKTYALSGPAALVPSDMVHVLAKVLGRPLRFEPQPDDEARAEMSRSLDAGTVDAFFRFAHGEFDDSLVVPTVQEITGKPPATFEQWARANVDGFAPEPSTPH